MRVMLHLLFWLLLVTYFAWGFGFNTSYKDSFINALMYIPGHMIMAYSLWCILVPRFLIKKKWLSFSGGFLMVLAACALYTVLAQLTLEKNALFRGFNMATGRNVLPFVHVAGIALSISLLKYWWLQQQQTMEAVQQKTAAELELLKSQVHPHFLFNTLNNLYSHVLEKSDKAPEIILKLSGLLRFMIYESNVASIPLHKEINLLKEYIGLEQLRYGTRLDVSLAIDGDISNKEIAPLLILPLIENAFKHGAAKQVDQSWITVSIHVTNYSMQCKILNGFDADENMLHLSPEKKGVGLQNVQKRLALLYPGRYHFSAAAAESVFIVALELHWKESHLNIVKNNQTPSRYEMEMSAGG